MLNASLLQKLASLRTVAMGEHQIDPGDLDMPRQHGYARVASGHQYAVSKIDAVSKIAFGMKHLDVGLGALNGSSDDHCIARGKVPLVKEKSRRAVPLGFAA